MIVCIWLRSEVTILALFRVLPVNSRRPSPCQPERNELCGSGGEIRTPITRLWRPLFYQLELLRKENWCPRRVSNSRPLVYKTTALPTELQGHNWRYQGVTIPFFQRDRLVCRHYTTERGFINMIFLIFGLSVLDCKNIFFSSEGHNLHCGITFLICCSKKSCIVAVSAVTSRG